MEFSDWPTSGRPLVWTLVTLAVSWAIGRVLVFVLVSKGPRWVAGRHGGVAECATQVVRRRLPWWSLLSGSGSPLVTGPSQLRSTLLVGRATFVLGTLSVTLALAAIASESVAVYGSTIAPALPVSSPTRNVAWALTAVLGLLVVLNGVGLSITPMLTALGVGGLAVRSRCKSRWRISLPGCSSRLPDRSASET